jgi:hypothetical protein
MSEQATTQADPENCELPTSPTNHGSNSVLLTLTALIVLLRVKVNG